MTKKIKILFILLILFISMIVSLSISVSKRIDTDEVRQTMIKASEAMLSGSKVKIGKVDYSMGSFVRIYLNKFEVRSSDTLIAQADKVVLKIPFRYIGTGNTLNPDILFTKSKMKKKR